MQKRKRAFRLANFALDEFEIMAQPVNFIRAVEVCFQIMKGMVDDSFMLLLLANRYAVKQNAELD